MDIYMLKDNLYSSRKNTEEQHLSCSMCYRSQFVQPQWLIQCTSIYLLCILKTLTFPLFMGFSVLIPIALYLAALFCKPVVSSGKVRSVPCEFSISGWLTKKHPLEPFHLSLSLHQKLAKQATTQRVMSQLLPILNVYLEIQYDNLSFHQDS